MADWFYPTLPSTGKPVTAEWGAAVQENPVAITEGAPGAPKISFPAMGTWFSQYGAIGTYVLAASTTSGGAGDTISGSSISPTGAAYLIATGTNYPGSVSRAATTGSALSGTWRRMGVSSSAGGSANLLVQFGTLYMRIA